MDRSAGNRNVQLNCPRFKLTWTRCTRIAQRDKFISSSHAALLSIVKPPPACRAPARAAPVRAAAAARPSARTGWPPAAAGRGVRHPSGPAMAASGGHPVMQRGYRLGGEPSSASSCRIHLRRMPPAPDCAPAGERGVLERPRQRGASPSRSAGRRIARDQRVWPALLAENWSDGSGGHSGILPRRPLRTPLTRRRLVAANINRRQFHDVAGKAQRHPVGTGAHRPAVRTAEIVSSTFCGGGPSRSTGCIDRNFRPNPALVQESAGQHILLAAETTRRSMSRRRAEHRG